MFIDVVFALLMLVAIIHGYRRGLIVAIFSFLAIIIGLAAALKLSAIAAKYIGHTVKISEKWLPIISFIVVFIVVVILVRLGAKAIQKLTETLLLGWVNRIGGIILYVAIYTVVLSVILFYAEQIKIIRQETIHASATYPYVKPWGPRAINTFAALIPFFKNMFTELEHFFSGVSDKISFIK
jgi:membrane protein required for colicin V production